MTGLTTRESMGFLEALITKKIASFSIINGNVSVFFLKRLSILIILLAIGYKGVLAFLLLFIELLLPIAIMVASRREYLVSLRKILAKIILLKDGKARVVDDGDGDGDDDNFFFSSFSCSSSSSSSKDPEIFLVDCFRDSVWSCIPHGLLCPGDLIHIEDHLLPKIIPLKIEKTNKETFYTIIGPIPLEEQLNGDFVTSKIGLEFNYSALVHFLPLIFWKNDFQSRRGIGSILISLTFVWEILLISWCNSRILTLSSNLNASQTPYVEVEGADEFDEDEPAPLKNIKLPFTEILKKSFSGLFGNDANDSFFWAYDLSKVLGYEISVISFLDREGTICPCFPKPLEVIFPNPLIGDAEHDDLAFGEFIHAPLNQGSRPQVKTNYSNTLLGDSHIKALGLAIMMSSNHGPGTNIHKPHIRMDRIPLQNIDSIMRSCPCIVGRELGFSSASPSPDRYRHLKDFWLTRERSSTLLKDEFVGLFTRTFTDLQDSTNHLISYGDVTTSISLSRWVWSFDGSGNDGFGNDNDNDDADAGDCGVSASINAKNMHSNISIKPLSPSLKGRLLRMAMNFENSDLQCVSITYRPILSCTDEICSLEKMETLSCKDEQVLYSNHIFLGCLISSLTPKDDMQAFIDDLENAGIRFVYFSPFNEAITKAFGDRLGLQTDWNCCINFCSSSQSNCSKLPQSVSEIRSHLKMVDDVPMNVSLFSSALPSDIMEMMKIYSEEGKGVLGIGSSMNPWNLFSFPLAALPLAMCPQKFGGDLLGDLQSEIGSFGCPIKLFHETSPYTVTEIVREGRCLWRRREGLLNFVKHSSSLFMYYEGGDFGLLFCNFIIASVVIFSFIKPTVIDPMKRMPPSTVWADDPVFGTKIIILLKSVLLNLFLMFLLRIVHHPSTLLGFHMIFGCFGVFVSSLVPFCVYWGCSALLFAMKDFRRIFVVLEDLRKTLVVVFLLAIFLFVKNTIEEKRYCNVERRSKLQFNTKLGMHSPI